MNIAMVGSVVNEKETVKYSAVSNAGNKMQLGFIRSLYRTYKDKIQVISIEPYKQWRGKGKIFIESKKEFIDNEIPLRQVFFINICLIKQITIWISIFINLLTWCISNYKDKEKVVIVYNTISYIMTPVLLLSKFFKFKSLVIVADVPIQRKDKSLIQKYEDNIEIELMKKNDLLIVLTEEIAKDFGDKKPYIVIEAGIEERMVRNDIHNKAKKGNVFNIIFSGSLNELSGIELAIKAMNKINDDNIKLNIYGKGYLEEFVKFHADINRNIKYCGMVSNEEMMEIQQKAHLLISPRIPDSFTTKYTFPSKIVEYMASGTPVLCNKLDGIPAEYYNYIIALDTPDELLWAETIETIYKNTEYYLQKSFEAKNFIYNKKTWEKRDIQIAEFLNEHILP